jgi:hypothetical protein
MESEKEILELLNNKSSLKQEIYKITKDVFAELQEILKEKAIKLEDGITDKNVSVIYEESGDFDAKLKFSGDTLLFNMHSNIFNFDQTHQIHQTSYVKEDSFRSFCGVINIYNFLSDSLKYNRLNDTGLLIARLFINKDTHYFIEGDSKITSVFKNIFIEELNKERLKEIINVAMKYALNLDLIAPNIEDVKVVSVNQILDVNNKHLIKTSKKMGYKLSHETNIQ